MNIQLPFIYEGFENSSNSVFSVNNGVKNIFLQNISSNPNNTSEIPYIIFIWNNLNQIIAIQVLNYNSNVSSVEVSIPNSAPIIIDTSDGAGSYLYTFMQPVSYSSSGGLIYTNTYFNNSSTPVTTVSKPIPPKQIPSSPSQPPIAPNYTPTLNITPTIGTVGQTFIISGNAYNNSDNIDIYINGSFWDNYPGVFNISYISTEPMLLNVEAVDTVQNTMIFATATIQNSTTTPFLKDYTIYQNQQFQIKTVAWNLQDSVGLYIQGGTQYPNETLLVKGNGIAQYTFNTGNNVFLDTGTYTIYAEDFNNNETTPMYQITVISSPTASTDPPSLTLTNGNQLNATAYSGHNVEIIQGSTVLASGTTTATYTVSGGETAYTSYQAKDTTNSTVSNPVVAIVPATITTNEFMNGSATIYSKNIILATINISPFMNGNATISNQTPILANVTENTWMNGSATISVQSIS